MEKNWLRFVRDIVETIPQNEPKNRNDLSSFVVNGVIPSSSQYARPAQEVFPPRAGWENYLPTDLAFYGNSRQLEFEYGLVEGEGDFNLAANAFAAVYLSQMIEMEIHRLFPLRMQGRNLKMMWSKDFAFTALGITLGCEPQASLLARCQLAAYRKGYYGDEMQYPIYVFIQRLLADYLDEPSIKPSGRAAGEPIFLNLFDVWREPDPANLVPECLAALDFHTHRCKPSRGEELNEFEQGNWSRIPIEIWLLFKLRERLGLLSPLLDHPMMEGKCGVVPADVGFSADTLVSAVYARMQHDGFDERAIFEGVKS